MYNIDLISLLITIYSGPIQYRFDRCTMYKTLANVHVDL